MSPSELRDRETREWLVKAAGDLASAALLAGANQEDNSLYHCQQTAEKSLKAFLVWAVPANARSQGDWEGLLRIG